MKRTSERVVFDTNVLVSQLVLPGSVPAEAFQKAVRNGRLLFSDWTMKELAEVLRRPKFDHYVSRKARLQFIGRLFSVAEFVPIISLVRECRDPADDKFLELALNGEADVIVTGDRSLLRMNPWRGIGIVTAAEFVGMP